MNAFSPLFEDLTLLTTMKVNTLKTASQSRKRMHILVSECKKMKTRALVRQKHEAHIFAFINIKANQNLQNNENNKVELRHPVSSF